MGNNNSNNNIVKHCEDINLEKLGFVLRNNENNESVIFYSKYACIGKENIDYGFEINNVVRRDKYDKIGDLRNFSKVGSYVYAFSNTKQCIVCINPTTFIINKYVCLSSLEYTYDKIIANREYIYAVSDDFSHMKQFNLDLDFERKIDLPHVAKYLSIRVIANDTFAGVFESFEGPRKIVIFTPEGIQKQIDSIMRNGKRYYLGKHDKISILNSDYFIVTNNTCCMLVSFETNCIVQQFEDEYIYYLIINSEHEFIIRFTYNSRKPNILCYIDPPCYHDQKQTNNIEQLSDPVPTIENINP